MNSSMIIFIFYGIANIIEFITGYFFMKCMDCTMKRREGKMLFLIGLVLYTVIATLVVFPKDMTNISISLLLFALANFTLYQGKWLVKLSMILIFLPITASVSLLHIDVGGFFYKQFFSEEDLLANTVISSVTFVVIPVFWIIFYRFFSPSLKKIQNIFTDKALQGNSLKVHYKMHDIFISSLEMFLTLKFVTHGRERYWIRITKCPIIHSMWHNLYSRGRKKSKCR